MTNPRGPMGFVPKGHELGGCNGVRESGYINDGKHKKYSSTAGV